MLTRPRSADAFPGQPLPLFLAARGWAMWLLAITPTPLGRLARSVERWTTPRQASAGEPGRLGSMPA